MKWHLELPEECPPNDAEPAEGEFYHYVRNDPPAPYDFVSQREMHPHEEDFDQPECIIRSVSMIRGRHDAMEILPNRVSAFRKKKWHLAVGRLTPKHGVVKN